MADVQTQPAEALVNAAKPAAAKTTTRKRRTRAKKTGAAAKKKENPIAAFMISTHDVDASRLPPVPEGDDVAAERRVRLLDALAAIDPADPAAPGDPLPFGVYVLGILQTATALLHRIPKVTHSNRSLYCLVFAVDFQVYRKINLVCHIFAFNIWYPQIFFVYLKHV